jgi:hypothetical protein
VDAVVLDVELHEAERREPGRVQPSARVQVLDHEEHLIDDDPSLRHVPNLVAAIPLRREELEHGA